MKHFLLSCQSNLFLAAAQIYLDVCNVPSTFCYFKAASADAKLFVPALRGGGGSQEVGHDHLSWCAHAKTNR